MPGCRPAVPCEGGTRTEWRLSTTLENEAIATVENEATQTDWMGDLCRGLGFDPAAVAEGVPQCQVARDLGVGRSTVERALASDRPPKYERPAVPTAFTPFEPLVRQLLKDTPDMPATVIAERVGWTGSIT